MDTKERLQELLERQIVVADGGMGTTIYQRRGPCRLFEEVNLLEPELVLRIHLDFIEAGARLIETNTFGANRLKLSALGLEDQVVKLNLQAVKLAREAREISGKEVFIAGSIGPLLPLGGAGFIPPAPWDEETQAQVREAVKEQARALEERGVDLFILETFSSLEELLLAVRAVQEVSSLPIVAQMTFMEEGRTLTGASPYEMASALKSLGLLAIGANCSIGPQDMLQVLAEMPEGLTLSAQPNAGFPRREGGRVIYPRSSPQYFAEFAKEAARLGGRVIGGCCGTTPEHIKAIAKAVEALTPAPSTVKVSAVAEAPKAVEAPTTPLSPLAQKLRLGTFVTLVEVDPPKGVNLERVLASVRTLKASGLVDAVDINNSPMARVHLDALMMAMAIEKEVGMETVPHVTTRDANIMGLQAALLGAWAVGGIRNILAVTGDPPRLGDYPEARGIYEIDAIGLARLLSNLNKGLDWAGQTIGMPTAFTIGVAVNPTAEDLDKELLRFQQKIEAGAHFAMTQPIFDPSYWERFLKALGGKPSIPILVGIWPLASLKLAERLHNEVPGIVIPEPVQERLRKAGSEAKREGFKLAREILAAVKEKAAGVYIIPSFKKYEEALFVLEGSF